MSKEFEKLLNDKEKLEQLRLKYESPNRFFDVYNKESQNFHEELELYNKSMERKVCDLVSMGFTRQEIGWLLGRSERQIFRIIQSIRFRSL